MSAELNQLPWIIFTLKKQYFAMNSAQVSGIIQLPPLTSVPEAPPEFEGAANIRGEIVPVLSLRALLQMPTLRDENKQTIEYFSAMRKRLEAWLNDFKRSVITGIQSEYDDNPAKCVFGVWLSGYSSDVTDINESKRSILNTFAKMAELAEKTRGCIDDSGLREEGMEFISELEALLPKADEQLCTIINILSVGNAGIAITLSKTVGDQTPCLGAIVDSVHSVDTITLIDENTGHNTLYASKYVLGIAHSARVNGEIIVLDEGKILEQLDSFENSKE